VYGGGFVPNVDKLDLRLKDRIEDGHDVVAGQGKNAFAAKSRKRLGDDVGSAQVFSHLAFLRF
jgi:hypothetical protein